MPETSPYDDAFYAGIKRGSNLSAKRVLPIVLDQIEPASVVDVGCGAGAWLSALTTMRECEVLGVDGPYVPAEALVIPQESFHGHDLREPLRLDRRFDLAMSLEVAEHLPPERGPSFVDDLVTLAPAVLFSAAIPWQGGVEHINLRWQSYWIDLFAAHGYVACDVVRPAVWEDEAVEIWYRQNTLLFVDPEVHGGLSGSTAIADVVHPSTYESTIRALEPTVGSTLRSLPSVVRRSAQFRAAAWRQRRSS